MNWRSMVAQVERVTTAKGRMQTGLFSVEGLRLVERAWRAGWCFEAVLLEKRPFSARLGTLRAQLEEDGVPLFDLSSAEMVRLTNGRFLGEGGVIGLLPQPKPQPLSHLLNDKRTLLLLTAVDIIDPGNSGALIRTAHAAGCTAFISVGSTDPYHPKAVRTSMGSLFKVKTLHFETVSPLFDSLAHLNILTVGAISAGKRPLTQATFPNQAIALFVGNEYEGLPQDLQNRLHLNLTIPMTDGIDSYSVNAAAAIMLYEINRQKMGQFTGDESQES